MPLVKVSSDFNVYRGTVPASQGQLQQLWKQFRPDVIIGHPTFKNAGTIKNIVLSEVVNAQCAYPNKRVSIVVSDGTLTQESGDDSTIQAATKGAVIGFAKLNSSRNSQKIQVVALPYQGYKFDYTPGKGSALKLIFDESQGCCASLFVLLDGDLRNDVSAWHRVYALVEEFHNRNFSSSPMFVTARYARHFVDASLTRFIVGPITTLMGTYVPGGISGDIALNSRAVAKERCAQWSTARRKYGTDISTTLDNIADPKTVVYEVYLGAKLHDITDEAKLSVMPGQVIKAALERLLYHEKKDRAVTKVLEGNEKLKTPVKFGPDKTKISFIDPGYTDVFDIEAKANSLIRRWPEHREEILELYGERFVQETEHKLTQLAKFGPMHSHRFGMLGIDMNAWIKLLGTGVAYGLGTEKIDKAAHALNYLYTAAFCEFVVHCLRKLGFASAKQVVSAQKTLGVPPEKAEQFYQREVDEVVDNLVYRFWEHRRAILDEMNALRNGANR